MNEQPTPTPEKASGNFRGKIKRTLKWSSLLIFLIVIFYCIYSYRRLPDVEYLRNKNPETTALIELRKAQAEKEGKPLTIKQRWVSFRQIPKLLRQAVRITEDAGFYQHEGLDYTELKESLKRNWEEGEYVRGGSTITQQLAKNLYLSTEKSLTRKIKEYFIAKRLERSLSKNRIFHLYLNCIEFGRGIFGVEAAARHYFNKSVSQLTLEEIVRLTAVIPRPLVTSPKSNGGWLKWKARWILGKLKLYKYISKEQYDSTIVAFRK